MPLAVSWPYAVVVWFAVDLQGSLALFWMVWVVTTSCAIGAHALHAVHAVCAACTAVRWAGDSEGLELARGLFAAAAMLSPARAAALALLFGSLAPTPDISGAALPACTTMLLYFSGFLIPFNKIP